MLKRFLFLLFFVLSFFSVSAQNACSSCGGSGIGPSGQYWDNCKHCGGCGYEFASLNPKAQLDWSYAEFNSCFLGTYDPFIGEPAEIEDLFYSVDPDCSLEELRRVFPLLNPGVGTTNFLTGRDSEKVVIRDYVIPVTFYNVTADYNHNLILSVRLCLDNFADNNGIVKNETVTEIICTINDYLLYVGRKVISIGNGEESARVYYCEDSPINDLGIHYDADRREIVIRHHIMP